MKSLVVFDSNFGNTKIIAEAISRELGNVAMATAVSNFDANELKGVGLIVAGSPIIGWKPSEKMQHFLGSLKKGQLTGIKAATFDTRVKLFIHGDAAKKISQGLKDAGAEIIIEPEAFYVKGKEGPLLRGEIEKARIWAEKIKREMG